MDPIAAASLRDLIRRFRCVGDRYPDLRCFLSHGLSFTFGLTIDEFGPILHFSAFTPLADSGDFWKLFYYHEDKRRLVPLYRQLLPKNDRVDGPDEPPDMRLDVLIDTLFDDAIWLLGDIGFAQIPGLPAFDPKQLNRGSGAWIWLLYHAAWACPAGTILRAGKFYPANFLARAEYKTRRLTESKEQEPSVEKRRSEWLSIESDHFSNADKRREAGQYASILPIDPFTASAALLELIAAGGTNRRVEHPAPPGEPAGSDDGPWSPPDTPTRWAKQFNLSWDTLKKRFEDGAIRAKKLSSKSYQVHINDLPSGPISA